MGNSLGEDLTGKMVVLKKSVMSLEYQEPKWRLFTVTGGFGAKPQTMGTALFGRFFADGEECRMEGSDVERLATEEDCPDCPDCEAGPFEECNPFCSGRWD